MRRLRTRAAGRHALSRSHGHPLAFACRRLASPVPFHATAIGALPPETRELDAARIWARCSVFWRQGRPLLVAECFLPAFWQLVAGKPVPPLMPHQRTPR